MMCVCVCVCVYFGMRAHTYCTETEAHMVGWNKVLLRVSG